jgi:hypothetical protein
MLGLGCGDARERSAAAGKDGRSPAALEPMTPTSGPIGYFTAVATHDGVVLVAGLGPSGASVLPGTFRWTSSGGWRPLRQLPAGFYSVGGAEVRGRVFLVGKDCPPEGPSSRPSECDGNLLAELEGDAWRISEIPGSVIEPLSTMGYVRQVDDRYLSVVPEGSPSAALALFDPESGEWSTVGYPGGMGSASMSQLCQTRGNTFAGAWTQLDSSTASDQKVRYRMWALDSNLDWNEPVELTATVIYNGSATVCALGSMMFQSSLGRQAVLERTSDGIAAREISVADPVMAADWGVGRIGPRVVGPPRSPSEDVLTDLGTWPVSSGPPPSAVESDDFVYLVVGGPGALPEIHALASR